MGLFETIHEYLKGELSLDRAPFEELAGPRYERKPVAVFGEFVRRVQPMVHEAAIDFVKRTCPAATPDKIEDEAMKVADKVFEDFAPEFASGSPSLVLVRFATAIRRVLDDQAFKRIATRYYHLLPIYHVKDDQQRRFLSAAYESGAGPGENLAKDIAHRFQVTVEEASRIIREGNRSLQDLIANDFTEQELSEMTESRIRRRH